MAPLHRSGGCRCGAIRYEVRGAPVAGVACHCRDCQYVSGGAENVSMVFQRAGFLLKAGEPRIYKATPASGGTFFCPICGVQVFSQPNSRPDLIAIKVGSLDDRSDFRVQADIWMKSAPPWHRPYEGARQIDGNLSG
ncbi:MAG: GFA family protein [Reyranellales bacterium]